jgi:dynein heavy chain
MSLKGILYAKPDAIKTPNELIRIYVHEAERVYCDKLVDKEDFDNFYKIERETMKKSFEVSYKIREKKIEVMI